MNISASDFFVSIMKNKDVDFVWGTKDCYTLFFDFVKYRYPNNTFRNIIGQYDDMKGAVRISHEMNFLDEVRKSFDIEIKDEINKEGDIVLMYNDRMPCVHIFDGLNMCYSRDRLVGFTGIPSSTFLYLDKIIFEIKGLIVE